MGEGTNECCVEGIPGTKGVNQSLRGWERWRRERFPRLGVIPCRALVSPRDHELCTWLEFGLEHAEGLLHILCPVAPVMQIKSSHLAQGSEWFQGCVNDTLLFILMIEGQSVDAT